MKRSFPSILLLIILFSTFQACKKNVNSNQSTANRDPLVDSAKVYFVEHIQNASPIIKDGNVKNLRTQTYKAPLWDQAYKADLTSATGVVVPLQFEKQLFVSTSQGGAHFFSLDNVSKLLLYKDATNAWHAELVTLLPDVAWINNCHSNFSGLVNIEDWWGNLVNRLLYSKDGIVRRPATNGRGTGSGETKNVNHAVEVTSLIATCYTLTGYNYAEGDPGGGVAWTEDLGCSYSLDGYAGINYMSIATGGTGGGSGSVQAPNPSATFGIAPPTNAIANISDYFKCFTNDPSASYQVTICVDQPQPGSRNPWTWALNSGSSSGGTNYVNVGHVFLTLTQTTGGTKITRNVGFYPSVNVTPFSPPAQGALDDNENDSYNISGSFSLNNTMFFNILGFIPIGSSPGYNYDVNNNNCTTFVINAMAAGHIYLPSTIGYWVGGMGNDPGDLGEDIRNNNFTGMTRSATYISHANVGTCN